MSELGFMGLLPRPSGRTKGVRERDTCPGALVPGSAGMGRMGKIAILGRGDARVAYYVMPGGIV